MAAAKVPIKHNREKVSVVVPRTCWTFYKLSNESDEDAVNRFIYSVLVDRGETERFAKTVLGDSFNKEGTEDCNAPWANAVKQIIDDKTVRSLMGYGETETEESGRFSRAPEGSDK